MQLHRGAGEVALVGDGYEGSEQGQVHVGDISAAYGVVEDYSLDFVLRWRLGFEGSGFFGLPTAFCRCSYGVGLSLFCFWSISFAPVRGSTHFLCRRKESKQRKRAHPASS